MSTSVSVWPIEMLRGIFGRVAILFRIKSLERMLQRATRINNSLKSTMVLLHTANREQAEEISRLEQENADLRAFVEQTREATRKVDPNAKCPNCGHCEGHLSHTVKTNEDGVAQVRVVNNCHKCGFTFCSAEPIAGAVAAAAAYQSPQEKL